MDTNTAISISGKPLTANHHCVSGAKVMSEAPKTRHGTGDGLLVAADAQEELISGEEQDDQSCRPVEGQSRGATQQQVPPVEWAEHFGGEPCRSVLDDEHVRRLITE